MIKNVFLIVLFTVNSLWSQHEPKALILGVQLNSSFGYPEKVGGNIQLNYAPNCYTTVVNEISIFPYENQTAFEIATSINLILNNFKRQHFILTGGIGLALTSITLTDKQVRDSFLSLSGSSNENHLGAIVKIKGLYQFKPNWNFVTSVNLKTLGSEFINFSAGLNYEFPLRR